MSAPPPFPTGVTAWAKSHLGRSLFLLWPVLLGQAYLGQVRFRPILACFDHPKCQDEKKEKMKKKRKRKRNERAGQAGDAFTQTWLLPAFRASTGLHVEHRLSDEGRKAAIQGVQGRRGSGREGVRGRGGGGWEWGVREEGGGSGGREGGSGCVQEGGGGFGGGGVRGGFGGRLGGEVGRRGVQGVGHSTP